MAIKAFNISHIFPEVEKTNKYENKKEVIPTLNGNLES